MDAALRRQIFNAFFFYGCVSVTLALGLAALVNGLAANLAGNLGLALPSYFAGFLAWSTAHWVYFKGKKILLYY